MPAYVERAEGPAPSEQQVVSRLREEGLRPHGWSNGPGDVYGRHDHPYEKVLYCVQGSITFHVADDDGGADLELYQGDRLVVPPGTPHAATVGAHGVHCVEAAR